MEFVGERWWDEMKWKMLLFVGRWDESGVNLDFSLSMKRKGKRTTSLLLLFSASSAAAIVATTTTVTLAFFHRKKKFWFLSKKERKSVSEGSSRVQREQWMRKCNNDFYLLTSSLLCPSFFHFCSPFISSSYDLPPQHKPYNLKFDLLPLGYGFGLLWKVKLKMASFLLLSPIISLW